MNKKIILPILTVLALTSCSKTRLLYGENAYNSPIFDENYYLEREDIDSLDIRDTTSGLHGDITSEDGVESLTMAGYNQKGYKWFNPEDKSKEFGYNNNLDNIEQDFNYGILSKLYDGRVRCEGYYQKSRVQLNKTGYATYFPKSLVEAKYIAFACRGGTSTPTTNLTVEETRGLEFNFTLSFYIHIPNSEQYNKVVYQLDKISVQTDAGGNTNLVFFEIAKEQLSGAVAMSLEWNCSDERIAVHNITDDYQDKEKDHLALMLYEVFIGESTWF